MAVEELGKLADLVPGGVGKGLGAPRAIFDLLATRALQRQDIIERPLRMPKQDMERHARRIRAHALKLRADEEKSDA
jgi:hypothetical protein